MQNIFKKSFFCLNFATSTRLIEMSHRVAVTLSDHTGPGGGGFFGAVTGTVGQSPVVYTDTKHRPTLLPHTTVLVTL